MCLLRIRTKWQKIKLCFVRFHVTSSALENPDSFYLHDVQKHSDEPPDLPQSSDTWMKFYTYLSKFMTQSSQQVGFFVDTLKTNPALGFFFFYCESEKVG